MQVQQTTIFLILFPLITESFTWFHHSQSRAKRAATGECCVSSKFNVGAKKANSGRDFFRRLSTETDSYKLVNPENMCNLMHFFIQQATLNNKSITFTKGKMISSD
jgi:hypothetical protein